MSKPLRNQTYPYVPQGIQEPHRATLARLMQEVATLKRNSNSGKVTSPDGTVWNISVSNSGVVSATK